MPLGPYSHQQDAPSPRAMKARESNAYNLIKQIAMERQGEQEKPAKQERSVKQEAVQQEQPMQEFIPYEQVETDINRMAFDEEGNFKQPPYEGYWLNTLETITKNDPYKQGPDWRDDAIKKFREARAELDQLEASIRM